MDSSFATFAFIMGSIAIAGIIGASVTHPIMYANPAIIFGFLMYFSYQSFREGKSKATVFKDRNRR